MNKIIAASGWEHGPVDGDRLRLSLTAGRVNADKSARPIGGASWSPRRALPDFPSLLAGGPMPSPIHPLAGQRVRKTFPKNNSWVVPFAGSGHGLARIRRNGSIVSLTLAAAAMTIGRTVGWGQLPYVWEKF